MGQAVPPQQESRKKKTSGGIPCLWKVTQFPFPQLIPWWCWIGCPNWVRKLFLLGFSCTVGGKPYRHPLLLCCPYQWTGSLNVWIHLLRSDPTPALELWINWPPEDPSDDKGTASHSLYLSQQWPGQGIFPFTPLRDYDLDPPKAKAPTTPEEILQPQPSIVPAKEENPPAAPISHIPFNQEDPPSEPIRSIQNT